LLVAIGCFVLRANMPTAKLTVHAVRPMGTTVTWEPFQGKVVSWPVWEFAITNSGRAPAGWDVTLIVQNSEGGPSDPSFLRYLLPHGILPPGQSTNLYVPLTLDSNS